MFPEPNFESWSDGELEDEYEKLRSERRSTSDDAEYEELTDEMDQICELLEDRGVW